jgi:hypothetical protein
VNTTKRTFSTPVALIIGALLIAGAYFIPRLLATPRAEAGTTDDLLKAISTKDTDGDGLPDWEEALYGTNPNKSDTNGYGMTDSQAVAKGLIVPKAVTPAAPVASGSSTPADLKYVPGGAPAPGSLTEQFAQNFFAQYLASHQGGKTLSTDDMTTFVTTAIQQLQQSQSQQDAFVLSEVKVSGSGAQAVHAYAVAAEAAFTANTVQLPKSELLYLSDAISKNDASAIGNIEKIAAAYTNTAKALAALTVPNELATRHLALANALAQMGIVTGEFAAVNRDPILTSVALASYTGDATAMRDAFVGMAAAIGSAGVVLKPGDPGYGMVSITPETGY